MRDLKADFIRIFKGREEDKSGRYMHLYVSISIYIVSTIYICINVSKSPCMG